MFSLQHPNILDVRYFFSYNNQKSLAIVLQYCPDGDLRNFIGKISPKKILEIQLQINKGLRYLHNKGLVHRDIKLENILMKNGKPKIADLGLTQIMKTESLVNSIYDWITGWLTGKVGSLSYISPEVFNNGKYSKEADIWSLGIVMLELCTGQRITNLIPKSKQSNSPPKPALIDGFPSQELLQKINDVQMRKIVKGMLQKDPSQRTSLEQIDKKIQQKKLNEFSKLQEDLREQLSEKLSEKEILELLQKDVKFPKIQSVLFSENQINDKGLKVFAQNGQKFPHLKSFCISSHQVTDKGIKELTENGQNFVNLKMIRIISNTITDAGLKFLAQNGRNFANLVSVEFGQNKITQKRKQEILAKYQLDFFIYFPFESQ